MEAKKSDFQIGPICLVAENADLSKGIFESVGWGLRYGELRKDATTSMPDAQNPQNIPADPIENKHSCTTNSDGPIKHVFKHCDVGYLKTQNWNCDMKVKSKRMIHFYLYLAEPKDCRRKAIKVIYK